MIDRERLIEEAKSAIEDSWGWLEYLDHSLTLADQAARAALAVFEKAHTPRFIAEDGLRTWVSEPPTDDERADHDIVPWSPTGRIDSPVSCQACGRYLFIGHSGDWEHVPQRTVTAQSEPSDPQVEAALVAWYGIVPGRLDRAWGYMRAALRAASEAGGEG